jgi:hypothetical protein
MDENELADILQHPNKFQIPHETEEPENRPENEHEMFLRKQQVMLKRYKKENYLRIMKTKNINQTMKKTSC